MRSLLGGLALALGIFLAFIVQEFIPPVHPLFDARVLLVPMLFCYGAVALSPWMTLFLALYTGFLSDLWYLQPVGGQVEIAVGWSIVFFVLFGVLSYGCQPAFLRGQWWVHPLLAALGTSLYLALQYAMICFRRQELIFSEVIFWRIAGPGLFAAILSPLLHLATVAIASFTPGYDHRRAWSSSR